MQSDFSFHLYMGPLGSHSGGQACIAMTLPCCAISPAVGSVFKQLLVFCPCFIREIELAHGNRISMKN